MNMGDSHFGTRYKLDRLCMGKHQLLEHAVNVAARSEHRSFKYGAVLVKNGKILSEGVNRYTTEAHGLRVHSIHAEENALRGNRKEATGSTMYIARVASYGPAMSKPCLRCQMLLKNAGVRKLIYTSRDGALQTAYL